MGTLDQYVYLNSGFHNELIDAIVESNLDEVREEIDQVQVSPFRCDASCNRMQRDNQFLKLITIDSCGCEGSLFLGIGEVPECVASGHVQALFKDTEQFISFSGVIKTINHITTGGETQIRGDAIAYGPG